MVVRSPRAARVWMDGAIDLVRPGNITDMIAKVWPEAEDFGFVDEMDAFGLRFGHGVGVGLHERSIISRPNSLDNPIEIKEGMYFALEMSAPADDGRSHRRDDGGDGRWTTGDYVVPVRRHARGQ